jgi:hypothetical protein
MKKPMLKLNDGTKVPLEEFNSWHHVKQWAKTRPIEEQKKIVAERTERSKRAVNTPLGKFNSVAEATKRHQTNTGSLRYLIRNTAFPEYNYDKPKPSDAKHEFYELSKPQTLLEDKVVTPLGKFPNKRAAERAHGISKERLNTFLRKDSEHYYFIKDGPKPNPVTPPKPPKVKKPQKPQAKKPRLSPEAYKEAIAKRSKKQLREVITPHGNFESCEKAAEFLGVGANFVRRLIHNTAYPEYTYVNPKYIVKKNLHHHIKTRILKITVTPFGTYTFQKDAYQSLGLSRQELGRLMKNHPKDFYEIEDVSNFKFFNKSSPTRKKTIHFQPKRGIVTPKGHFVSKPQAALAHKKTAEQFQKLLETKPDKYFVIKKAISN